MDKPYEGDTVDPSLFNHEYDPPPHGKPWYLLAWQAVMAILAIASGALFLLCVYLGQGKKEAMRMWRDIMRK